MNDTVLLDIATNKITDVAKFDVGQLCMITGGRNTGRVGMVQSLEKHKGSFTIAHIKDAQGNVFSTRSDNVFVIGSGSKPLISLPKGARAARRLAFSQTSCFARCLLAVSSRLFPSPGNQSSHALRTLQSSSPSCL